MRDPRRVLQTLSSTKALPSWATSGNFRDFEDGAEESAKPAIFNGSKVSDVSSALGSQRSDGNGGSVQQPGFERVGFLTPFKEQILKEAQGAGFNAEESNRLFDEADKRVTRQPWKYTDRKVTPTEDRFYRQQIESLADPALREKARAEYEKALIDGRLKPAK